MDFLDRVLLCSDCGKEFVFTAGEQLFFFDKQFKNDPKRCKPCKAKRGGVVSARPGLTGSPGTTFRAETRTECSTCKVETTVPFKPTQGRPVLCRQCFQQRRAALPTTVPPAEDRANAVAQMKTATAELIAASRGIEHSTSTGLELAASLPA